jgi:trypsin-like peptidase
MLNEATELPVFSWEELIRRVEPLVFRVHAGPCLGTGFVIGTGGRNTGGRRVAIATAWHVIEEAAPAAETLELVRSDGTALSTLVSHPVEVMQVGPSECDTALILAEAREPLIATENLLPLPLETMLPRGSELGWIGYPGLVAPELCFFRGVISGYLEKPPIYLVDGVAIHGVSGGPAFSRNGLLVGFVSSYLPNVLGSGQTLPGLMIVTPLNLVRLWMQEVLGAEVLSPSFLSNERA